MLMSSAASVPSGGAEGGGAPAGGGAAEPTAAPAGGGEPSKAEPSKAPEAPTAPEGNDDIYEFPAADSYAWDNWDGKSFDEFDPHLQPWLQKAHAAWGSKAQQAEAKAAQQLAETQASASRWERLWTESLSDATTDSPHVQQAVEQAKAAEVRATRAEARMKDVETRQAEHDKRIEAFVEEQSKNYEQWFTRAYPDIANDSAKLNTLLDTAETLGEEWDTVAELMNLGDMAVKLAKEAKEQGLPSHMLMPWVKTNLKAAERDGVTRAAKSITDSQRLVSENDVPLAAPRAGKPPPGKSGGLADAIREAVRSSVKKGR